MRLVEVEEAVGLIRDGTTVIVGGSGAGHAVPQRFIDALAEVYRRNGHPRDLTTVRVVGIGDFADRGFSQLAIPGLMRRTIGSNIGNEPRLAEMVADGEIEAYSFPQGVLSQLSREIAAGRPGLITRVGLHTYVDPRQTGGKQGSATEDLVEVVELAGREWLFFHAFPIDVAVIRGSTIDEEGNLTLDEEAINAEMLPMAMAARNSGGIVIAQAKRCVPAGSLTPRRVHIPGALVDYAYLDPDQTQTYLTDYSPYYAGAERLAAAGDGKPIPLDVRKVIARRSLLEFAPGQVGNLGFGISQDIGAIAREEGIADLLVLTVEQGVFGGVPAGGADGGAGLNYQALIDQPYMFDFYDGGGIDIASLSFAEVDAEGNINVHAFGDRLRGPGGFPNISTGARKVCFVGTLTTGGLEVAIDGGRLRIEHEGKTEKFVDRVNEISFSGRIAAERGQEVRYITERAVFALIDGAVVLIEVAEGIDPEADVIANMGFRPQVAPELGRMDRAVFAAGTMGLRRRLVGGDQ
ncbi:MAG: acyl CoA:acetate/3-ketoacid CoA transferase [Acidimicrobiia bacterium]|nr:MAG: acyl CoA:acetate/3-ketoacid CoA transferase [Acidimicrobiia bacterium]